MSADRAKAPCERVAEVCLSSFHDGPAWAVYDVTTRKRVGYDTRRELAIWQAERLGYRVRNRDEEVRP